MRWREELDKEIAQHIEELVRKTNLYPAFKKSDNPSKAQLWVALGLLSKKLYEQELKVKLLEQVLKDISPRKSEKLKSEEEIKKTRIEVEKIMKEIAQGKPVTKIKTPVAKTLTVPRPPMSIVFPKIEKKFKKRKTAKKTEINDLKRNIKRNF